MVDRRIIDEDLAGKIGLRIKAARILTNLNQEEFSNKNDFGIASVKNWELGRSIPRDDAVSKIVKALDSNGVLTTRDWILFGTGSGPCHKQDGEVFSDKKNINQIDILISQEINMFERNCLSIGKRPIIGTVADSFMEPYFFKGDIIGAQEVTSNCLKTPSLLSIRTPFLVELEPNCFQPRFLGYDSDGNLKYYFSNSTNLIEKSSHSNIGKIVWFRRKD